MLWTATDDFDLALIQESGQCFRISEGPRGTFRILSADRCLLARRLAGSTFDLSCDEDEFRTYWYDYFDLGLDYRAVRAMIDPDRDRYLFSASQAWAGIRILAQDPFETLVSFIISQNRNIPAIRNSIELLAKAAGELKVDADGKPFHAFPSPEAIAALDEETLGTLKLGYRAPYVRAAAEAVSQGTLDLASLVTADERRTQGELTKLFGVGPKVCACVSLFGLHHLDSFPVDVWVRRVLEREYPQGFPFERYAPYNGIFQQYLFCAVRFEG